MAIPLTKGNTTVRERPDSPEWDYNTQKVTCTRTFEGMYADLLAASPPAGSTMEGYSPNLLVENVKIKKAVSGKTTMIVVLETLVDPITNPPTPVQPVYEIEWTQVEKPLEQAPAFRTLFNVPLTLQQITVNQAALFAWENETDPTQKATLFEALLTADSTGNLQQLAAFKACGQTSYLEFGPVARITSLTRAVNPANACGVISSTVPGFPSSALPGGYQWLSTADRSTRTGTYGKWQRVQEWTGAQHWDTRCYTASSNTDAPTGS